MLELLGQSNFFFCPRRSVLTLDFKLLLIFERFLSIPNHHFSAYFSPLKPPTDRDITSWISREIFPQEISNKALLIGTIDHHDPLN